MLKILNAVAALSFGLLLLTSCYKERKDMPVIVQPDTTSVIPVSYKDRAKQVWDNIIKFYAIPGGNLLRESYPAQPGDPSASYLWSHTSMAGAGMLLKSLGFSDPSFQKVVDGLEDYWDAGRLPAAYQSSPRARGQADRFYDDNAIVGIDLLRAYEETGNTFYLDRAKQCLVFDISGETTDQGGGLFWNEQYRLNNINHPWSIKAANVTALAANLALQLYKIDNHPQYLEVAKRWYLWVKTKLQDPADKIIWNDIAMKDGKINMTKWTYNTGAMITNAVYLHNITGEVGYLTDAKELALASHNYFTRLVGTTGRFFPPNDPWFTMILLRGYLDLYAIDKNEEYINTMIRNVDYAWLNARNADGQFFEDWAGERAGRYHWILTQECMVEIYALISIFKKE